MEVEPAKPTIRNYETLDAIVVVASLVMVTGLGAGLLLIKDIDQANLPVIASLGTAILGLPVSYGAFRWGSSIGAKVRAETDAKVAEKLAAKIAPEEPTKEVNVIGENVTVEEKDK